MTERTQDETSQDTPDVAPEPLEAGGGRKPRRTLRRWLRRDPPAPQPSIVRVMAEWAEYQVIFNDILVRLSAQLARQAQYEKKRLKAVDQAPEQPTPEHAPPVVAGSTKAALRSRYAMQRFGGRVQALLDSKPGGNGEYDHQGR